jgi:Spy/CpxP family protein refolding chaperone
MNSTKIKAKTKTISIKKIPAALWILSIICLFIIMFITMFTSQTNAFFAKDAGGDDALLYFGKAIFSPENDFYIGHGLLDYSSELKLTPRQKEKIEDMILDHETVFLRVSAEIKIKELRFTAYLKSNQKKLDRKVVEQYIREISKEKTDLAVKLINHLLDLKNLLTPEQIKTARQLKEDFFKSRGHRPPNEAPGNQKEPMNCH